MTDREKASREEVRELILREVVEAHRNRYARAYRRRFGSDPPGRRVRRIVLVRLEEDEEGASRLYKLLGARGAVVAEWRPEREEDAAPVTPVHAWFVGLSSPPTGVASHRVRTAVARALATRAFVAIAPEALAFVAEGGELRGRRVSFPLDEEAALGGGAGLVRADGPVSRDRNLLTCLGRERLGDLVRGLLDLVHATSPEGVTER